MIEREKGEMKGDKKRWKGWKQKPKLSV